MFRAGDGGRGLCEKVWDGKAGADSHLCELTVNTATKSVQSQPFLCTLLQHAVC
jgi:hypothetical protein